MTTTQIARQITEALATSDGLTYDVQTARPVTSGGTCVALPGYETIVPASEAETATAKYIDEHADLLASGVRLGLWLHDGALYLDLVEVLPRPVAVRRGRERGELAVYDLDADEVIPTAA